MKKIYIVAVALGIVLGGCGSKTNSVKIYENSKNQPKFYAYCGNGEANKKLEALILKSLQEKGISLGSELKLTALALNLTKAIGF